MAAVLACTSAADAQTLSLARAFDHADEHAFANRIARSQAREQSAHETAALRGILPALRFEGGVARTTDPIGTFGTTLRQRRISQQDFDPARLNHPAGATNYLGSVILEQPLLNADAHLARHAARRMDEAASAEVAWTSSTARLAVIRAYYGAVLAAEKAATLEIGFKAARAHVDQAERLTRAGLATRSDALLAGVKAGEVEVELIAARGEALLARQELGLVIGLPRDTAFSLPARLPSGAAVNELLAAQPLAMSRERADVRAAERRAAAASTDVLRARSLYLPRLNAFARYDWNSPTRLFEGDKNWSVGVMMSWSPFAGGSEWAEQQAAGGRAGVAEAAAEAARAQAELEIEAAATRWHVARARLEIAQRNVAQSAEAHRIVSRKYEGGLATVLELLDAAASETQASLSQAFARYSGIMAAAEQHHVLGLDLITIARTLDYEIQGVSR